MSASQSPDELAVALLGEPLKLTRREVAERSGVSLNRARRFWHAFGFPTTGRDDVRFTDADCAAMRGVLEVAQAASMSEEAALSMARAFASTTSRLASWQVQLLTEDLAGWSEEPIHDPPHPVPDDGSPVIEDLWESPEVRTESGHAQEVVDALIEANPDIEKLLLYAWRRHLLDTLVRTAGQADAKDVLHGELVVGFADLVDFTSMVNGLSEREIARVVERFEAVAASIVVHHHGRIVKNVGDEVVFTCADPVCSAHIAVELIDTVRDDEVLPSVRVAMAQGPVVARHGDVYGPTVNRAARLADITHPDGALIDSALAALLSEDASLYVRPIRRRRLRGVGVVTPYRISPKAG